MNDVSGLELFKSNIHRLPSHPLILQLNETPERQWAIRRARASEEGRTVVWTYLGDPCLMLHAFLQEYFIQFVLSGHTTFLENNC